MLHGRDDLLAAIDARLCSGGGVALHGPPGIGRSVLLDMVAGQAAARGELVLRLRPARGERGLAYAGAADLVRQVPAEAVAALAPAPRHWLAALRQGRPPRTGGPALARRLVLPELLAHCARTAPVLLVVDDAQWLDPQSAGLIEFAMRRRPGPRIRVLAASTSRSPVRLCPAPVADLAVPPLDQDALTTLLEERGLPCKIASRLHRESAGNPFVALALSRGGDAREWAASRLSEISGKSRETLVVAALATEPTTALLLRAGREDAERELREAETAGLITKNRDKVRFTPPLLAERVIDGTTAHERSAIHGALSRAAVDPIDALRHRALRTLKPDAAMAHALADAARRCAQRGADRTAAELYVLAADRCPHGLAADRLDWLVVAARTALTGGSPALARRAADAVLATESAPAPHRVRARLVLIDLAGQDLAGMAETFAAALAEAGDDPALLAPVRLRLTWQAFLAGDVDRAADEARQAEWAAHAAGDPATGAMALSALAQIRRTRGEPRWRDDLDRALALPVAPKPDWLHYGPQYTAARFALFDDRLDEARADLLALLAVAEHDRVGEARVEVLRSLSEVATRAGRCQEALRYAHRATRAAQDAGLSPGPTWYTAAVAELAGGSLAAAAGFARRGIRASEQESDGLYLRRNLHALAQSELRAGDTRAGVATLRRLRDLEAETGSADPMIVRWHADLAAGLAALGEHDSASATLMRARLVASRLGAVPALAGYLDRAAAIVESESGRADDAVQLSTAAATLFEKLRQPVEQAHALLVAGGAERRRRRYAAARVAIGAALALFMAADARPWAEETERVLTRTETPDQGLTSTELRIAAMVRDGASNREIAARLYLSVKTVEATLTRVYRKLGVRSRTQLLSRLAVSEITGLP
jgi:DNA-binding CsgD family transcriptional regulator